MILEQIEKSLQGLTTPIQSTHILVLKAIEDAIKKIPPMWDLRDYVAVNPFFGLRNKPFLETMEFVQGSTGATLLPQKKFFKQKWDQGEISIADIEFAIQQIKIRGPSSEVIHLTPDLVISVLREDETTINLKNKSISDHYDEVNSTDLTGLITKEVSKWLSAYFDEGQSTWKMPFSNLRLFQAWKKIAVHDLSLTTHGFKIEGIISKLSHDPFKAIEMMSGELMAKNIDEDKLEDYFYRLLCSVAGWAAFIQKIEFEAVRTENKTQVLKIGGMVDLLAIRMAYDLLLLEKLPGLELKEEESIIRSENKLIDLRYVWLLACENAYRRNLLGSMKTSEPRPEDEKIIPDAQLVFCIDVRSETMRRHIEQELPNVETLGFAGFFGLTVDYKGLAHDQADQQCPVLLNSKVTISEISKFSSLNEKLKTKKSSAANSIRMKKNIQSATNSCFSFVEAMGATFAWKMLMNAASITKPDLNVQNLGLDQKEIDFLRPDISNIDLETMVSMGFGALKNMGLTKRFAPLVFLMGHGSESSNNPYSGGLDCGACAGHSGLANSRILASILNDPKVRAGISLKGIAIPQTTLFVSGVHQTTTDLLKFDIPNDVSMDFTNLLSQLQPKFKNAEKSARMERSKKLSFTQGLNDQSLLKELHNKAMDWSEIRPEWGLAGNATFVVGRRERTKNMNLGGRSFLHDYDAKKDSDGSILELIMTAPMIVTNWINMQYYASTVDSEKFGSGNKTTHNVVGTIGVIQGNSSDLQVGLSAQSVKYKDTYIHEPIRLQVVIEASIEKLSVVINKHELVRNLVENEWLNLISLDPMTNETHLFETHGWIKI